MRHCYTLIALVAASILCLSTSDSAAQSFAAEQYPGNIVSYDDTVGTVVNPDTLLPDIAGMSLDHQGRLLLASQNGVTDVIRFDIDAQTVELLDPYVPGSLATDVCTDLGDDIYVLKQSNWKGGGGRQYESWIGILPGGTGPIQTAYTFEGEGELMDLQVWPFGERAGNLLVLTSADGRSLIEIVGCLNRAHAVRATDAVGNQKGKRNL